MLASELRRKYIEFFISKGSQQIPSSSLVPGDPTLLFTNAGMVQFKPYFLGLETPPATRATTVQKCFRTTDIEVVGDTSHCTFFEMLGNFSFGDYFKAEAIQYAWEFLFDVLKVDIERIRVTIYKDDDAFDLWRKCGMPERKIFRMDVEDNYWFVGPTGPCGPDSEIFWDTQPDLPPTPDGVWDDSRWLEIWNLVFMTYDRDEQANLNPLPKRNIDTGMGLERTAAALANLRGPFETDLFTPIIRKLEELTGLTYTSLDDDKKDIAFRRVADHARATAFCLADGILPSNIGQGYVLRRVMRRAILAGRNVLGLDKPFLDQLVPTVIDHRKADYPELEAKRATILRYATIEETQFRRTLEAGTARLQTILDSEAVHQSQSVTGDDAFVLHTTYGFPVEMTSELAGEIGATVDMARYEVLWKQHLETSEGGKPRAALGDSVVPALRERDIVKTLFVGYSEPRTRGQILAIVQEGHLVHNIGEGETGQIVLDQSPFYAESGGQVGDTGWLHSDSGAADVADTQKDSGYWFHTVTVTAGELRVEDTVEAEIDSGRRTNIQRNHTTTHLLHKALQMVLGAHVQQRGSLVASDRLRFDFSHDKALTNDEARQVEGIVNEKILDDIPVQTFEKPIEDAKQMGATMLFGEKYGDVVRVVQAGDFSLEFCGGTHLQHTSQAGLFKIVSEGSSQAGVRRIEAVTGKPALMRTLDQERLLHEAAAAVKTSPAHILNGIHNLKAKATILELKVSTYETHGAQEYARKVAENPRSFAGNSSIVKERVPDNYDSEMLQLVADEMLNVLKSGVVILGSQNINTQKVSLIVKVSKDLVGRGLHAGNIVKAAAQVVGGGGGGRPDSAQAGGKDPAKLSEALATAERLAVEMGGA